MEFRGTIGFVADSDKGFKNIGIRIKVQIQIDSERKCDRGSEPCQRAQTACFRKQIFQTAAASGDNNIPGGFGKLDNFYALREVADLCCYSVIVRD